LNLKELSLDDLEDQLRLACSAYRKAKKDHVALREAFWVAFDKYKSIKLCPPVSRWWNVQSMLLLHGKAIHQWIHHKVVQEIGSLPVWQAGVNQQPSSSNAPTRLYS